MKRRKIVAALLTVACALSNVVPTAVSGAAPNGQYIGEGYNLYYRKGRNNMSEYDHIEISYCEKTDEGAEVIIIPDTIEELPVTSIGKSAFDDCSNIKSINIPEKVDSIGEQAFNCSGLTHINVSESNNTFCDVDGVLYNKNITEIIAYPQGRDDSAYTLPDSVTTIKNAAFYKSLLTEITFSDKLSLIEKTAFARCGELECITIPDNIKTIEGHVFYDCKNLNNVQLPASLEKIEYYAFSGCTNLKNIKLPKNIKEIGEHAFYKCCNLADVNIPVGVTSIGRGAFRECSSLTSINIPSGITAINDDTFRDCKKLKNITIPNDVKNLTIGEHAFTYCPLSSIDIPEGVDSIADNAFSLCNVLENINVSENNKSYSSINGVLFNKDKTELIIYPLGKKSQSYTIPSGVTKIGKSAFYVCTTLRNINIPNSVTVIEAGAFWACCNLKNIIIPEGVETIEQNLFYACSGLESLTIKNPQCVINHIGLWNSECVIYGPENSTAQKYAEENNMKFEIDAILGDLNSDGEFTIADLIVLQKYLVKIDKLSSEQYKTADLNKDNSVNVFDYILFKRKLINIKLNYN